MSDHLSRAADALSRDAGDAKWRVVLRAPDNPKKQVIVEAPNDDAAMTKALAENPGATLRTPAVRVSE
jgi:hypothetical protein